MKINIKTKTAPFNDLVCGAIFYDPDGEEYCMKINSLAIDDDYDEINAVYIKNGETFSMPLDAEIIPVNAEMTVDR
jgi:hypothetical protein